MDALVFWIFVLMVILICAKFVYTFRRKAAKRRYVLSEDEKNLREQHKDKWIKLRGEDDPHLEAVLNAAFHGKGPVFATVDDDGGLKVHRDADVNNKEKEEPVSRQP